MSRGPAKVIVDCDGEGCDKNIEVHMDLNKPSGTGSFRVTLSAYLHARGWKQYDKWDFCSDECLEKVML